MKKIFLIGIAFAVLIVIGLAGVSINGNFSLFRNENIKIGVSLPLTGPVSSLGTWSQEGMLLAQDEINSNGGINGISLNLIFEDDGCNAQKGLNSVNKLINFDKTSAIIVYCGAVAGAVADFVDDKALLVNVSVRTEHLENKYPFLFNLSPSVNEETKVLASEVLKDGINEVAIIYQSDFYGETYKNKFKKNFSNLGGTISYVGSTDNYSIPDFRNDLIRAKDAGAKAIFSSFNQSQYVALVKQAKELNLDFNFYSSWNIQSPLLIKNGGELVNGIKYTYSFKEGDNLNYNKFKKNYYSIYNRNPESNAANGYDAVMIIAQSLKSCGEDSKCLVLKLGELKNYEGMSGKFSFENKVANKNIFLKTIQNGKFEDYN